MSGHHATVHEDVRQTGHKDESAFLVGCTQCQALELVLECEAQDRGGACRNSNMLQVDAQVLNEDDTQQLRVLFHFPMRLSRNSTLDVEDVANNSPPKHCPLSHGLHFLRVSSNTHHLLPLNQSRVHFQTAHGIGYK